MPSGVKNILAIIGSGIFYIWCTITWTNANVTRLPLGIWMKFHKSNFQINFGDLWLKCLMWNYPQMIVTGLTDDKSTLISVMSWCHQAANHYWSQCSLSFVSPYGIKMSKYLAAYTKWTPFYRHNFFFLEWKVLCFDSYLLEDCFWGSNLQFH